MKNQETTSQLLESYQLRQFGLVMGGIICVLFGIIPMVLLDSPFQVWPWVLGLVFILLALVFPGSLKWIHWFWMRVGNVLGYINSRIILSLVFYLMIFPVGVLLRLFGKDPMRRGFEPESESYRLKSSPVSPGSVANDLEKPY